MSEPAPPSSEVVTVERREHIAVVWLDRPDKHNALGPAFWTDFPNIMDALSADRAVRAIVLAGRGPGFTVGLDLVAFGPAIMTGDIGALTDEQSESDVGRRWGTYHQIKRMQRTCTSIADNAKPVIAAIHGYCIGAGIDLTTACDIRLAAADAVFSVRETRIAMVADVGTLQRLPRIIDPGRVAELVYTGRDWDAAEAREMGYVTRVYPDGEAVVAAAIELATQIAANSPLAVQGSKAVLHAAERRAIDENLDYVALWNAAFLYSNDLGEAIRAFLEKRPPDFTGD